ncbi:MAG: cell division protein FtsQ/DivIB [Comamonas sp.]
MSRTWPPQPQPFDVRFMNGLASLLFAAAALLCVGAAASWVVRQPVFALRDVVLRGDVERQNAAAVHAQIASRLGGNFFTLDLAQARQLFEDLPWVRQALVRRAFPNELEVVLQEHQAVAYWGPADQSTLVNSHGEVFEASRADVEDEDLLQLDGPPGTAAEVLRMAQMLAPLLREGLGQPMHALALSVHGGWHATLASGARIDIGRGTDEQIRARVQRFVETYAQAGAKYGRTRSEHIETADLRYADGYAVKWVGVTTDGSGGGRAPARR